MNKKRTPILNDSKKIQFEVDQNMISGINFVCRYHGLQKAEFKTKLEMILIAASSITESLLGNGIFETDHNKLDCYLDEPKSEFFIPGLLKDNNNPAINDVMQVFPEIYSNKSEAITSIIDNYLQSFTNYITGRQDRILFKDQIQARKNFLKSGDIDMLKFLKNLQKYPQGKIGFLPSGNTTEGIRLELYTVTSEEIKPKQNYLQRIK